MPNRGYDQLYFKGIISEHKKQVKKNGALHTVWETTTGVRNEPLDLRVYNLACMQSCNPNWDRLKAVLTGVSAPVQVEKKEKKAPKARVRRSTRQASIW